MNLHDIQTLEKARQFHCKEAEMLTDLSKQEAIGPVTSALVKTYRAQASKHEAMAHAIARALVAITQETAPQIFSLGTTDHPVRVGDAAYEAHIAQQRQRFGMFAAAA